MVRHWIMDYETICNAFVGVFIQHNSDVRKLFVINAQQNDYQELIEFFDSNIKNKEFHISFNGLAFDSQISHFLLDNRTQFLKLDGEQLSKIIYAYSQEVISKSDSNMFLDYAPWKMKIKQLDLFKMNHWDNRAKMSSLKWIQYSMDWYNVEEMPHHHAKKITTIKELENVIKYCVNDVLSTKQIFLLSKEQIQLRINLTSEYNIDLYSASEPKISKELFMHFLCQSTGIEKAELKALRTPRRYIVLADCILPYVKFQTSEFENVLKHFQSKVITSTKDDLKYSFTHKNVKTDYGLGGIHGAIASGIYKPKPGWTIMSSDVTSYYPNLAIKNGFHPEQIPKEEFCRQYEWFFEERKKIPKTDPKNYVYKIILNSTYGLSGDENSFLYDPKMTMQITINGQLLLTMLYEMLSLGIPDSIPLMQNTDGLEMMIPDNMVETYFNICKKWELITQLSLEHAEYSKMIIGDVNNYIAVDKNGKAKCKGRFEWEDLSKYKINTLHKNKSFLIIPKAIYAYFVDGIKPEDYLDQNKDIMDYCAGVKSKGAWYIEERKIVNQSLIVNKQQKIVRYFISNNGSKLVKCHSDGREIQVEAGQWMQRIVNKIDINTKFEDYDIDFKYYLENIYKEINQIEKQRQGEYTQLSLNFL